MQALLRACQVIMAAVILLIATITFTDLPQPYPSWPTIGSVPVNPELVVPGLLGVVTTLETARDGVAVSSVIVGILGVVTLWLSATSLHALYTSSGGGVFFGGFFTLISGIALSVAVVVRASILKGRSTEFNFLD